MGVLSFISDLQGLAQRKALAEQELANREADRQAEGFRQQAQLAGMRELEGMRAKNERENLAFRLEQEQKAKDIAKVAADKELQNHLFTIAKTRGILDPVQANAFAHDTAAKIFAQPMLTSAQTLRNEELLGTGAEPTMTEQGRTGGELTTAQNIAKTTGAKQLNQILKAKEPWLDYIGAAEGRRDFTAPMSEADIAATKGAAAVRQFDTAGNAEVSEAKARQLNAENLAKAAEGAAPYAQEAGTFDTLLKLSDATNKINTNERQRQIEDIIPAKEEAAARLDALRSSAIKGYAPFLEAQPGSPIERLITRNPAIGQRLIQVLESALGGTTTAAPRVNPPPPGNTPGSRRVPNLKDIE